MLDSKDVLSTIKKEKIEWIDLLFTDLRGVLRNKTIPTREFTPENIKRGFGFDGSSLAGYKTIFMSDMLVKPDLDAAFLDPFTDNTLCIICDAYDPVTDEEYDKDPRLTAKKSEKYLKDSGVGKTGYFGPELEFFVFDEVDVRVGSYDSYLSIRSTESAGEPEADGYAMNQKGGYFTMPPYDKLKDYRNEVCEILESIGIEVEAHHHEVATSGQVEIDMKYKSLVQMADQVILLKYIAKRVAATYGMTAVFLPKPIFGDNGTGMHIHHSVFDGAKNIMYDKKGYASLSKAGLSYIGGILDNVEALLAFTNASTNSYRRLVPHFEAPTAIGFSQRNRSAAIRIPLNSGLGEKSKRMEFRSPDATANPYLAFAGMVVMGVEGVKKKLDPSKLGYGPFDEDIWEMNDVKQTPANIFGPLMALSKDKVLIKSGVFSKGLIESYVEVKTDEAKQVELYPTPADFAFYGDL